MVVSRGITDKYAEYSALHYFQMTENRQFKKKRNCILWSSFYSSTKDRKMHWSNLPRAICQPWYRPE